MHMNQILRKVRDCTACAQHCPLGCKPLVQIGPRARILIIGQAPGQKAHTSGIPWNDASGNRLRDWLGMSSKNFYDPDRVALMPMGFCFPGTGASGDLPPRPECAPLWHEKLLRVMPNIALTVLIGKYALDRYAPELPGDTMTTRIAGFRALLPNRFPLVHPSPRNGIWLRKNPWFMTDLIPELRKRVLTV